MQFSENWLRTMVNPGISSDQLAYVLTMAGLEVESVEPVAPPFSKVVVAEVVSVTQHPNADRLRVCQVDAGTGETFTIVCGAPNVRAGMKVPCALVGAVLPPSESEEPVQISVGQLRGVESQGMLCSASDLKLLEQTVGLLELPANAPIGQNFRDYYLLNDSKFTIKLTPNKADCLSVLGIAREVAAITETALKLPTFQTTSVTTAEKLSVNISAPDLCGRFSGRVIRGLNAAAITPQWMKQGLERSGLRSITALVDISNYVMLELGRPSHIFDLSKVSGSLEVRWGRATETVTLLNGSSIAVDESVGVIADAAGVEALAGIMGGEATSVTLATRDIYIEAAFWYPKAIQGRARRFNFSTDAAHRFERGVDYATTVEHIERITSLIVEICGQQGETLVGPIDDQITNLPQRYPVTMRTARASKVIGVALTDAQVAAIFTRLGLDYTHTSGTFIVVPPSYRFDLEIEEDLIEEVARVYGFENIPALPPVAPNVIRLPPENHRSLFKVRRLLADLDYQEVVNYSFVDAQWEIDFADNALPIKVLNPIASQMSVMRSTLIGSLIANVRYNLNRKIGRIRIFEIGAIFNRDPSVVDGPLSIAGYQQPKRVAAIAYGTAHDEQWAQENRSVDFFDVKADLEALVSPYVLRFEACTHPALHPGRSAKIVLNDCDIGFIGQLHPRWQQKYELPLAPIVFEIDAAALQAQQVPIYQEVSKFPAVVRDIALVVGQSISAQKIIDIFTLEKQKNPSCKIMQAIVLFDEYKGKGLQPGEKSLAFRITLQDTQSTLQDDVVEVALAAFVAVAEKNYDAKLRA
jgi:phenylalanyl-tRNA synthetase beta chain